MMGFVLGLGLLRASRSPTHLDFLMVERVDTRSSYLALRSWRSLVVAHRT